MVTLEQGIKAMNDFLWVLEGKIFLRTGKSYRDAVRDGRYNPSPYPYGSPDFLFDCCCGGIICMIKLYGPDWREVAEVDSRYYIPLNLEFGNTETPSWLPSCNPPPPSDYELELQLFEQLVRIGAPEETISLAYECVKAYESDQQKLDW